MYKKIQIQKSELKQQFLLFRITNMVVDTLAWAFFSILIYKNVGGYLPILSAFAMLYIGNFIGFTIFSFLVDRLGFLISFRTSMLLNAVTALIFAVSIHNFVGVYLILSFLRGFTMGTFWPTSHLYLVKEVHNVERSYIINTLESIILLIQVFLPAVAGSLIAYTGGFAATFYFSTVIYIFGAIYPFKYNKKTISRIHSSEITRILKRPFIGRFLLLTFFNMAINTLLAILMTILPYIFIKSEFGVGVLASVVGIFAALVSFFERNQKQKLKENLGLVTWISYSFINILFALVWTMPFLIARTLLLPFTIALGDTSKTYMDTTIREKILGDFRDESTLELNMIIEAVFLFARIISILIVYLLLNTYFEQTELIIRLIVGICASLLAFAYIAYKYLNNSIKIA